MEPTEVNLTTIDPTGLQQLLHAVNCAGFAEQLLRNALQNHSRASEDSLCRSYLEEGLEMLRGAVLVTEQALAKLPKLVPADPGPPGDPNQADREWSIAKEAR